MSDGFFVKFLRVQTDITSIIKHVKLLQVLRIQLNKCRCCLISVPALCVWRNSAMESKVLTDAYLQPHATLGQQNVIFINWMGADKTTNEWLKSFFLIKSWWGKKKKKTKKSYLSLWQYRHSIKETQQTVNTKNIFI